MGTAVEAAPILSFVDGAARSPLGSTLGPGARPHGFTVDTFPGAHCRLDLFGVAAVAGFARDVLEAVAEGRAHKGATLVRDHRVLEPGVLGGVEEDVDRRLLTLADQVHLLEEHLPE